MDGSIIDPDGSVGFHSRPVSLETDVTGSGVDTGGSGGSMNRGPQLLGAPSAEPQKFYARK